MRLYFIIKRIIRTILPKRLYARLLPLYHRMLAYVACMWYRHPSRKMIVIGVTGTKGKSSVTEMLNAIFETAGYNTALLSTIRFKVGRESRPNMFKMTMPGRFFVQRFFRDARRANCDIAIVEMTSEGVKQSRHRCVALNALVFTNLSPEHIESHGSFENYVAAKLEIGKALARSPKRPRIMVANADDAHGKDFLALPVDQALPYSLAGADVHTSQEETTVTFDGVHLRSPFPGTFTAYNMLAAATCARAFGISTDDIQKALANLSHIPGRVEYIDERQPYPVIVDYAHTKESLEALYTAFSAYNKVCVLGNTGGGRDTWKRPHMAACAENYCTHVILTDEDPYDEDPEKIVADMAAGMKTKPRIIMDRREAIAEALALAEKTENAAVLITGKGTDPYIMRTNGTKEPWSDARVAREELQKRMHTNASMRYTTHR